MSLVELRGVSKSFGATRALDDVSLALEAGEVTALAGENGAGKSTLIRILSGVYSDYRGELWVGGSPRRFSRPEQAQRAGIVTIHQELSLIGSLSVADNLLLRGGLPVLGWVYRKRERERARALLERLELDVDPDARVETLPLAARQLVEIARAVGRDARLLILDEPTSALGEAEARRLIELVEQLKALGTSVLYVSHRMEEIYELADRIVVLRDGRHVLTRAAAELPRAELLHAMLGRALEEPTARPRRAAGAVLLEVRGLRTERSAAAKVALRDVTFEVRRGEIVGVTGLAGSGAPELLQTLYGELGAHAGSVALGGRPLRITSPRAALRNKIAFVPGDRAKSMVFERSVLENLTLSSLVRLSRFGFVAKGRELEAARQATERLPIAAPSLLAEARALSGGNQQKTALLRACLTAPELFLFEEATRGVDVGARHEIYELVRELAERGAGVLWLSFEIEELLALCDRILVLSRGEITLNAERGAVDRARLLSAAMGRTEAA